MHFSRWPSRTVLAQDIRREVEGQGLGRGVPPERAHEHEKYVTMQSALHSDRRAHRHLGVVESHYYVVGCCECSASKDVKCHFLRDR
jgi:hypothetical protein